MAVIPRPVMTVDDYLIAVISFWMGPLHNFKREEQPGVDTLDDETGTTRLELPLCNSQEKWIAISIPEEQKQKTGGQQSPIDFQFFTLMRPNASIDRPSTPQKCSALSRSGIVVV